MQADTTINQMEIEEFRCEKYRCSGQQCGQNQLLYMQKDGSFKMRPLRRHRKRLIKQNPQDSKKTHIKYTTARQRQLEQQCELQKQERWRNRMQSTSQSQYPTKGRKINKIQHNHETTEFYGVTQRNSIHSRDKSRQRMYSFDRQRSKQIQIKQQSSIRDSFSCLKLQFPNRNQPLRCQQKMEQIRDICISQESLLMSSDLTSLQSSVVPLPIQQNQTQPLSRSYPLERIPFITSFEQMLGMQEQTYQQIQIPQIYQLPQIYHEQLQIPNFLQLISPNQISYSLQQQSMFQINYPSIFGFKFCEQNQIKKQKLKRISLDSKNIQEDSRCPICFQEFDNKKKEKQEKCQISQDMEKSKLQETKLNQIQTQVRKNIKGQIIQRSDKNPMKQQSQDIAQLVCNHIFHMDCIQNWLKQNVKCPLCRQDYRQDKPTKKIESNFRVIQRQNEINLQNNQHQLPTYRMFQMSDRLTRLQEIIRNFQAYQQENEDQSSSIESESYSDSEINQSQEEDLNQNCQKRQIQS